MNIRLKVDSIENAKRLRGDVPTVGTKVGLDINSRAGRINVFWYADGDCKALTLLDACLTSCASFHARLPGCATNSLILTGYVQAKTPGRFVAPGNQTFVQTNITLIAC